MAAPRSLATLEAMKNQDSVNHSHNVSASSRRSLGNDRMANLQSAPHGAVRQRLDAKKRRISMRAITARFTDKPVKLDDAEERRVLTALEMIYEGGSLDGKTANFPIRDLSCVVVGLHRGNWHFFETYKRTINVRNRRTIFRWAGLTIKSINSNNSSWWERLLLILGIRKLKAIVI
jgi:hypothetical protein